MPPHGNASIVWRPWMLGAAAGVWGGGLAFLFGRREGFWGDFLAWWYAARVMIAGGNPYLSPPDVPPFHIAEPFFYPLTAAVGALPFAPLSYLVAFVVFFALSAAVLGYAIAKRRPELWPVFFSFPFLMSASFAHWSALLTAGLLLPAVSWIAAVKPNLALAMVASRPSRIMLLGGAAFVAVSVAVDPTWPAHWINNMRNAPRHPIPALTPLGIPLLWAFRYWRDPDARLVGVMACLPQTASFADQLLLMTVARTRKEALLLAVTSLVGGISWVLAVPGAGAPAVLAGVPFVTASVYLPALLLIVRREWRPNVPVQPSSTSI